MSVSRLFHTIRWLRGRQLVWQLRSRLGAAFARPAARAQRLAPPDPGRRWSPRCDFPPLAPQRHSAEELRAGSFSFLNRSERLGWPPRWTNPELPRLWQYNLHYFEYLWALPYEDARCVVRDWIARHGLARGRVGWEPYPTSLRLLSWCAYFFAHQRERSEADRELSAELWASLQLQADWLAAHPEYHLMGNHLLENAAALAFCGACFGGAQAEAWLRSGVKILRRELIEQVLPDGGHFERSPMYHVRVVTLLTLLGATGHPELERLVAAPRQRMLRALEVLQHPDREIALFNDSAFGIASRPDALCDGAPAAGPFGPFALPDTGYYGARNAAGDYVVCDAAPIGPDYIPGHAHGDIFSFELSLAGHRVIVDAGVHDYEAGEMRRYCRSTRAHNTVEVDGEDQCEFWAVFRVARRGRPHDVLWEERDGGFHLEGWHDGYARLPGRPRHGRRFRWHPAGVLLVRDRVSAQRAVTARSRVHLHPDCELLEVSATRARVRHPGGEFQVCFAGDGELSVESAHYCPEFGKRMDGRALVFTSRGAKLGTGFCVAKGGAAVGYDLVTGASMNGARYVF